MEEHWAAVATVVSIIGALAISTILAVAFNVLRS
jgi:hypothetical protein